MKHAIIALSLLLLTIPTCNPTPTPEAVDAPQPATVPSATPGALLLAQGTGDKVTDNFTLPTCQKSVFSWSVEPTARGDISLLVKLSKAGSPDSINLVLQSKSGQSGPLAGEVLQGLSGGSYYLAVSLASGAWAIRWECGD